MSRRADLAELATLDEYAAAVDAVVHTLADARLVTTSVEDRTGRQAIEISHEALIRAWPRLRGWIDDDRAALRIHRRLTEAAQEWQERGHDADVLYRGARLAAAREWRNASRSLNALEREFLDAS